MPTPDLPETQIVDAVEQMWGLALQPAGCLQCGQAFLVDGSRLGQACPNCASGKLESQPARLRSEPPELQVPFRKGTADIRAILENFVKGVWLAPDDFTVEKLLHRAVPVFWPMWLVDGDVVGEWRTEAGFDYQVKSSQESFNNGSWHSHEVIETRQRWEPRTGQIQRRYNNVHVPAASDHARMIALIGDYRLDQATQYESSKAGKADLRIPDLQPQTVWTEAQMALDHAAQVECQTAAGAQHSRNFSLRATYESLNWTQMLLPVAATFYVDDDGKSHPVYINGQSGMIGGVRMASQRKGWKWAAVLAGIGAALLLLGLLLLAFGAVFPPFLAVGSLAVFIAVGLVLCAIVPAAWPWQWNRKQLPEKIVQSKQADP
jgi:hypothetical protein